MVLTDTFRMQKQMKRSTALVCRSDIPYAALAGEDPQPDRRHVFHLEGLPPGSRHHDIAAAFAAAGVRCCCCCRVL